MSSKQKKQPASPSSYQSKRVDGKAKKGVSGYIFKHGRVTLLIRQCVSGDQEVVEELVQRAHGNIQQQLSRLIT